MTRIDELEKALHGGGVTVEIAAAALDEIAGNLAARSAFLSEPAAIDEPRARLAEIAADLRQSASAVEAAANLEAVQQDMAARLHPDQRNVLDPEQHQITYVIAALRTLPAADSSDASHPIPADTAPES